MKKRLAFLIVVAFVMMMNPLPASGSSNEKRLELSLYNRDNKPLSGVSCNVVLPEKSIEIEANQADYFCQYIAIGAYVESGISFTKKTKFTDPETGKEKSVTEILGKTEDYWSEHGYWKQFLSVTGDCTSKANYGRNYWSSVPVKDQFEWGDTVSIEVRAVDKASKTYVECYVNGGFVQSVLCGSGDPRKLKSKGYGNASGFVRVCQGVDDTSGKVQYDSVLTKDIKVLDPTGKWVSSDSLAICRVYGGSYRADHLTIQLNDSLITYDSLVKLCKKQSIKLTLFSTSLNQRYDTQLENGRLSR